MEEKVINLFDFDPVTVKLPHALSVFVSTDVYALMRYHKIIVILRGQYKPKIPRNGPSYLVPGIYLNQNADHLSNMTKINCEG